MALPLLGSAAWLPAARATTDATVERSRRALMGTQVDIVAHGASGHTLQAAAEQAWQEMARLAALIPATARTAWSAASTAPLACMPSASLPR